MRVHRHRYYLRCYIFLWTFSLREKWYRTPHGSINPSQKEVFLSHRKSMSRIQLGGINASANSNKSMSSKPITNIDRWREGKKNFIKHLKVRKWFHILLVETSSRLGLSWTAARSPTWISSLHAIEYLIYKTFLLFSIRFLALFYAPQPWPFRQYTILSISMAEGSV